jgi:hypothetical protein
MNNRCLNIAARYNEREITRQRAAKIDVSVICLFMFSNSKRVATIIAREALRAMTVSTSDRRRMSEPSSLAADSSGDTLTFFFKQMHPERIPALSECRLCGIYVVVCSVLTNRCQGNPHREINGISVALR